MKKFLLSMTALLGLGLATVNSAVAMQWQADLGFLSLAPAGLMPTLPSPCAIAGMTAPDDDGGASDENSDQDPSEMTIEDWVVMWVDSMNAEDLDAILGDQGLGMGFPYTGDQLVHMSADELAGVVSGLDEELLAQLETTQVQMGPAKPCKTKSMYTGWSCQGGRKCVTFNCVGEDGAAGNCKNQVNRLTNAFAYWHCPQNTYTSYHCLNGCPAPAAGVAASLFASLMGFGLFRRRLGAAA